MRIELKLFASLREAVNLASESLEVPDEVKTTNELRLWLSNRGEEWKTAFAPNRPLRIAVNQSIIESDVSLVEGQEVAFFPPVTGG